MISGQSLESHSGATVGVTLSLHQGLRLAGRDVGIPIPVHEGLTVCSCLWLGPRSQGALPGGWEEVGAPAPSQAPHPALQILPSVSGPVLSVMLYATVAPN